uniref:Uncharacterized protein n=1 Tax=Rhizophora mucronata TaxID=61149 RepID=A0A2P2NA92_RHIMU
MCHRASKNFHCSAQQSKILPFFQQFHYLTIPTKTYA